MNTHKKINPLVKSLAAWQEGGLQSAVLFSAFILAIIIMLSWPDKLLYKFIINGEIPKTFSIVTISIVLLMSLLSLVFGRIEARKTLDGISAQSEPNETARAGGLKLFAVLVFRFVINTGLLSLLFIPLLLPGVAISRLSWADLAKTIAIICSTAFAFRIFGFAVYLILGKRDVLDTLFTGFFFLAFFLFTLIWFDFINPLVLIYHINLNQEVITPVPISAFGFYHLVLSALVLLSALVGYLKLHFHIKSK